MYLIIFNNFKVPIIMWFWFLTANGEPAQSQEKVVIIQEHHHIKDIKKFCKTKIFELNKVLTNWDYQNDKMC